LSGSQTKRTGRLLYKSNSESLPGIAGGLPIGLLEKLKHVVLVLVSGDALDARYRDHALVGSWQGSRDCHIEPDWLLIYRKETEQLFLERTGSHSELFKK
jgi:mRNA interferase YafQ